MRKIRHRSLLPRGPQHVFEFTNRRVLNVLGEREYIERPVRAVFPELEGQGYFELLDEVCQSGKLYVGQEVRGREPRVLE